MNVDVVPCKHGFAASFVLVTVKNEPHRLNSFCARCFISFARGIVATADSIEVAAVAAP
jgi:hypothetical protein